MSTITQMFTKKNMRKNNMRSKLILCFLLIGQLIATKANAQVWAPPSVTRVTINTQDQNGIVPVSPTNALPQVITVDISRQLLQNGWAFTWMNLKVELRKAGAATTILLRDVMVDENSFRGGYSAQKELRFNLPANTYDSDICFTYSYYNSFTSKWEEAGVIASFLTERKDSTIPGQPPAQREIPQVWEQIKVGVVNNLSSTDYHIQRAFRPSNTQPILKQGQKIVSQNGQYQLELQSDDGNLVLYRNSDRKALWATNHDTRAKNYPYELWFYETGELAVVRRLSDRHQIMWKSGSYVDPNSPNGHLAKWAEILVQNDGNMVMYAAYNRETTNILPFRTQTGGGWESPHFGYLR